MGSTSDLFVSNGSRSILGTTLRSCALVAAAAFASSMPASGQLQCEQRLVPSDAIDTVDFGFSVAVNDEWSVIGARIDSSVADAGGAAYFFHRASQGWTEAQRVTASDIEVGLGLGAAVSISGGTAVIGAPYANAMGSSSGAAYVFEFVAGSWVEVAKLLAPDGAASDNFGFSVSVSGDNAVVGSEAGAYAFERMPGLGWIFVDKLTSSVSRVAVSGGHILTGGGYYPVYSPVIAFERIGQTWISSGSLYPSGDSLGFGASISISGDRAAVGAHLADDLGDYSGAAYVFEWSGSNWIEVDRLLASDGATSDRFGISVSISDARLLVGAIFHDGATLDSGGAYVFDWDGAAWNEVDRLEASDGAQGDYFGYGVALEGDAAFVGAHHKATGAAYVFFVPCSDCNNNQVLDSADIAEGTSQDCNSNGIPDECDIAAGTSLDCELNGVPDECDYASFASVYCDCGSGAPCGNEDPDAGCANVTGNGAAILPCGTASILADDLLISASGVLPNVSGLFFMGGGNMNQVPFGDGQLCVFSGMQGVKRYRPSNAGAPGVISLGPGVVGIAEMRFGTGIISPGQTWNFQCWYRDPIGPCGNGYNMSNAVSITFAP